MCLGMPRQIIEIDDAHLYAQVDVDGVRRPVSLAMPNLDGPGTVAVGDWVLVHVGFALSRMDEEEAREILDSLTQLEDMYERELGADDPQTTNVS